MLRSLAEEAGYWFRALRSVLRNRTNQDSCLMAEEITTWGWRPSDGGVGGVVGCKPQHRDGGEGNDLGSYGCGQKHGFVTDDS